jgi:tetratricopeptide (TPR) repeat protein
MENQTLSQDQQMFMAHLLYEFGLILESADKMQDALRCYEYAEDLCSHLENEDPYRYNLHAKLLVDLGIFLIDSDTSKAFAYLEKARRFQEKIANQRTVADLLLNLGLVCEKQGNNNQAMLHYENAVKVDFDDPDLFGLISFNCSRLSVEFRRNLDVSIAVAEQGLMADIQDQALVADLHWLVMIQLHKRGRSGDIFAAIAKGNHALDLPFQNAQIRTKLLATQAQLYQQAHNKKEAARHFKLAAGIEENSAATKFDFLIRAAALHNELQNYKGAITCLKGADLVADQCSSTASAKVCLDLATMHLSAADKSEDNEESAHLAREARFYLLKGLKIEHDNADVKEKLAQKLGFHFFWENGIEALGTQEEQTNVGRFLASGSDVQKVETVA